VFDMPKPTWSEWSTNFFEELKKKKDTLFSKKQTEN